MKSSMKNRAGSKGCIAEYYFGDKVMMFVMHFFDDMDTSSPPRVDGNLTYVSSPSNTLFPPI